MSVPEVVRPQYLRVRNWEHFQHYKNRRPPWIKYHVEALDDYELTELPIASRLLYTLLLLVAARTDNNIPRDPYYVSRQVSLDPDTVEDGLQVLMKAGFLILADRRRSASKALARREQDASNALASRAPAGSLETETEKEEEKEITKAVKTVRNERPQVSLIGEQVTRSLKEAS